jgi:hypothetical protein
MVLFCPNQEAHASFVVDFAFDPSDPGYSPATPNVLHLVPGQAAATYHIDIFGTAFADSPQPPANFQLQRISTRGSDDGGIAFATGSGIGPVNASFAPNPSFNDVSFAQPQVADIGKTTDNGATITSGADGISDFGGTTSTKILKITSGPPAVGSGPSPVSSFTWMLGTFAFNIGTASLTPGSTTKFWPTLLLASQGASTAAQYTTTGGPIAGGPVSLSSAPLTFTAVPEPATIVLLGIGV